MPKTLESQIISLPEDKKHLQGIWLIYNKLYNIVRSFGEITETNAGVWYQYLILKVLLNSSESLDVTLENLAELEIFQDYVDAFGFFLFGDQMNLAISHLQYLLNDEGWREYIEGGEELITG